MVQIFSSKITEFPDVNEADKDGLIAIGGQYDPETLLKAYKNGIFPWFDESFLIKNRLHTLIYWFSPDPRFVLFKKNFRISKRLLRYYKKMKYQITFNKAFLQVIKSCQKAPRKNQYGTWISDALIEGFYRLYKLGYILSVEVWDNNLLIGGLYGVKINKYFCGESMFNFYPNASKFAFIKLCEKLFYEENLDFIDCQVYSKHLEKFGACQIPRKKFIQLIKTSI